MSEYQYYEWLAVDRPLTEQEMDEVNGLSSHMEVVTATQAVVTYQWGSFKHDPAEVLFKYFDAMLYAANWGSRRVAFRFPAAAIDAKAIQAYCVQYRITLTRSGKYQVLNFELSEEEGGDWIDVEGVLWRLIPVREQIMQGDYRALYLAWLKAMELEGEVGEEEFEDEEDGERSESGPPVPAGLRKLNGGLKAFTDLFEIDAHLVKAAAESSATQEPVSDQALAGALPRLSRQECEAFLLRFLQSEPGAGRELRKRLSELAGVEKPAAAQQSRSPSSLGAAARRYEQEERQREQVAAERKRIQELEELSRREQATWTEVERLIELKQAKPYVQAVALLVNLRDLAAWQNRLPEFEARLRLLMSRYGGRWSLMERLRQAGLASRPTG